MLDKAETLKGYKLEALDGEIGKVREFYFDDLHWTIRYLIAETGNWFSDRQVLISPYALAAVIKEKRHVAINLTGWNQKEERKGLMTRQNVPLGRILGIPIGLDSSWF